MNGKLKKNETDKLAPEMAVGQEVRTKRVGWAGPETASTLAGSRFDCVLAEGKAQGQVSPLILGQWTLWVVPTDVASVNIQVNIVQILWVPSTLPFSVSVSFTVGSDVLIPLPRLFLFLPLYFLAAIRWAALPHGPHHDVLPHHRPETQSQETIN